MSTKYLSASRRSLAAVAIFAAAALTLLVGSAGGAPARSSEYPTNRSGPTISGTAQEGQTLQANNGQWLYSDGRGCGSECVYTYQWQRCNAGGSACADIPGATSRFYVLTSADVGNRVRVNNTMTKHDCNARNVDCRDVATSYPSAPTAVVTAKPVAAPVVAAQPSISGTAKEGQTLTAVNATFGGGTPITHTYQWQRCDSQGQSCGTIAGATAQTYTLVKDDVGHTMRVVDNATNTGGSAGSTSPPSAVVAPLRPAAGPHALWVDEVLVPDRLRIDRVTVAPKTIRTRAPITVRIRVSERRRLQVRDAVVSLVGVPFGQLASVAPEKTGPDGYATFVLQPTAKLPAGQDRLYLYVTATKPGDDANFGVATSRLVVLKLNLSK